MPSPEIRPPNGEELKQKQSAEVKPKVENPGQAATERIDQANMQTLKARTDLLNGKRKSGAFDSTMREDLRGAAKNELAQIKDPNSARFKEVNGILKSLDDEEKNHTNRAQKSQETRGNSQREYTSFLLQKFDTRMKSRNSYETNDSMGTFLTVALAKMEESQQSGDKMKKAMKDPSMRDLVGDMGYVYANDLKSERDFLTSRINIWGNNEKANLIEDRIAEVNRLLRSESFHGDQASYDAERWDTHEQGEAIRKQYFAELRAKNPPGETMSPSTLTALKNAPMPSPKNSAEVELQNLHDASHAAAMKDLPTVSAAPRGNNIRDKISNAVADSKNVLTSLDEKRMGEIDAMKKELSGVMAYKQAIAELQKEGKKPEVSSWILSRYDTIRSGLLILAKDYPSALDDVKPDAELMNRMKTLAMQNVAPDAMVAKNDRQSNNASVGPRRTPRMSMFTRARNRLNAGRVETQNVASFNRGAGTENVWSALSRFFASFRRPRSGRKIAGR